MLTIQQMGQRPSSPGYYSTKWRITLENHLNYLRMHPQTKTYKTTELKAYHSRWDLHSLLTERGIPEKYFWVIMRVNGFKNPTEFHEDVESILIPDDGIIEDLYRKVMKS